MKHPDSRLPRRGFSLVELLTTIAVLTILLGLAAGLIKLLLKLDQSGRDAMATAADLGRLARTFRDDAHRATPAQPPRVDGDRLSFPKADDQTVAYTIRPHDLLREVRRGDKVVGRELYRRPARGSVRFEATTEAGRPLAAIIFQPDSSSQGAARADRLEAEVGRLDRQIARRP